MTPDDLTPDQDDCQPLDELYTEGIVTDDGDVIDLVNPEQDE